MKIIILILIEKLHRYVFDTYYVQNYSITQLDKIVLMLYRYLVFKKYNNWRHDIKAYCKKLIRYDGYDRLNFDSSNSD